MASELLVELFQATVALTGALALVAVLRRPLQRWLGAGVAYAAWMIVPLAVVAVWLPARTGGTVLSAGGEALVLSTGLPAALPAAGGALAPILLAVWLSGAFVLALLMGLRQRRFQQSVQREPGQAFDHSGGTSPAVTGLLRPRIVLPDDFQSRYTPREQRLVIAHEQMHIARGDIPAQALASLLRCLFWFHPLVHLAARRFRFDQELACDAAVIERFPDARRSYGDAMLKTQLAASGLPLGCHWQSCHPLKERILMLKQALPGPRRRRTAAALVVTLAAMTSLAAWAAQPAAPFPTTLPTADGGQVDVLSPPKYPASAAAEGVGGLVLLDVLVGDDGLPKEIKVFQSSNNEALDQAAVSAAGNWRFNAGRNGAGGEKAEGWVRVPVNFTPDKPAEGSAPH